MAPVVRTLQAAEDVDCQVIVTAQHRQLLDQMLADLEIRPDHDLDAMTENQTLATLTAALLLKLDALFRANRPDLVLVQGDTTTAFAAAQTAFYHHIPVGHVEAGLRTHNPANPFPEELNRSQIARLARLHFAPHENHRRHLLAEGIPDEQIYITGNTVIDALQWILERASACSAEVEALLGNGRRTLLLTTHRRESFGPAMRAALGAIAKVVQAREDTQVLFPVHLNPQVLDAAREVLGEAPRVYLLDPMDYPHFVRVMAGSHVILSDSGGVQEEAPALGKPVLVLRDTTERPEVIEAGCAELTGTDPARITVSLERLLDNERAYSAMAQAQSPYGTGDAARKIAGHCRAFLRQGEEP